MTRPVEESDLPSTQISETDTKDNANEMGVSKGFVSEHGPY